MNIFEILQVEHEAFHSRMLAWLLTPEGTHRCGTQFSTRFMKLLGEPTVPADVKTEVTIRVPGAKRWRLADILVRNRDQLILIENKVDPAYQDVTQISEEVAGGRALANAEQRQFVFVLVAPGPLTAEVATLLTIEGGRLVLWSDLLRAFETIDVSTADATCQSILNQYWDYCRSRFGPRPIRGGVRTMQDPEILKLGEAALRHELSELPSGEVVIAPDLWKSFCERYPDHISRLEARWEESSHFSAKAWFALRLQQMAAKNDLLKDTGRWTDQVDEEWGFPRVRIYERV